jgi:hypothetical protein
MRTNKKITGVLLTLMLISGIEVHAQLGGLLDKAKEKATKTIEKKIDKNSPSEKSGATINAGNSNIVTGDSLLFNEDFSAFQPGASATSF